MLVIAGLCCAAAGAALLRWRRGKQARARAAAAKRAALTGGAAQAPLAGAQAAAAKEAGQFGVENPLQLERRSGGALGVGAGEEPGAAAAPVAAASLTALLASPPPAASPAGAHFGASNPLLASSGGWVLKFSRNKGVYYWVSTAGLGSTWQQPREWVPPAGWVGAAEPPSV